MARSRSDQEVELGDGVRTLRIAARLTQDELAERANISIGALKNLERGRGSTTTTLVRVVHALGRDQWLADLAPAPVSFNPLDLIQGRDRRRVSQRVRKPKTP
jgi:transcriptional regulator with XRE-family HTH domain